VACDVLELNPARQVRHKSGGWLQGFVLVTSFTTWQRWFQWNSLAPEAALAGTYRDDEQSVWDNEGALTAQMDVVERSGDPEKVPITKVCSFLA